MKIRLTESQYKRLLNEDNQSFIDGTVRFKNIGNKVDKAIAKLFIMMYEEGNLTPNLSYLRSSNPYFYDPHFRKIIDYIALTLFVTKEESILLAHNYSSVMWDKIREASENNDITILVGEPLQFFGEYVYSTTVLYRGYVNGSGLGNIECYATDVNNFKEKIDSGFYELEGSTDTIDSDSISIDWELDKDFTYENIQNEDIELNRIIIKV
jgi:hypothetical protein